jgi:hypothetical protein
MLQGRLFSYGDAQRNRLGVSHHIGPEGRSHGSRGPLEGVELALSGLMGALEEVQVRFSVRFSGSRTSRRCYTCTGREAKKGNGGSNANLDKSVFGLA